MCISGVHMEVMTKVVGWRNWGLDWVPGTGLVLATTSSSGKSTWRRKDNSFRSHTDEIGGDFGLHSHARREQAESLGVFGKIELSGKVLVYKTVKLIPYNPHTGKAGYPMLTVAGYLATRAKILELFVKRRPDFDVRWVRSPSGFHDKKMKLSAIVYHLKRYYKVPVSIA